jgi:hypothetical protein
MKRHCNEDDWRFMSSIKPPEAPCGKEYDDETNSTICPHEALPPKLSEEELQARWKKLEGQ